VLLLPFLFVEQLVALNGRRVLSILLPFHRNGGAVQRLQMQFWRLRGWKNSPENVGYIDHNSQEDKE
jgi:hypothetical protein